MDSILDFMNDEMLNGQINDAIKTSTYNDVYPVFDSQFYNWQDSGITSLRGLHQLYLENQKGTHDGICKLLSKCMYRETSQREAAEMAIDLIEKTNKSNLTSFGHYCRGLVYFPDILERYLRIHREKGLVISEDDIGCMIARCIEHPIYYVIDANESLKHLLNFKEESYGEKLLEIKLLPKKYNIDDELYKLVKVHNIHDTYYDNVIENIPFVYHHLDVVAKERAGLYTGFRDAYHCLLYGGKDHLQALIVRWDLWGPDTTTDAAREYFDLDNTTPIEIVISRINKRC